jgi:serine/threonine-protein kinase
MGENDFVTKAITRGLINFDHVKECLKVQEAMAHEGHAVPIWEVLQLKGYLTPEQVQSLHSPQKGYAYGPYLITAKLGEGGMGVVYLARRQTDDAIVALKLLPQPFSDDSHAVKRFEREAVISIQLSHPNLIKGYEYGKINNHWYYVMEYVKGKTVARMIHESIALDERTSLKIVTQVAQALIATHQAGIVHRDIKPDNIIISEDGVAKLMDLGLAKQLDGTTSLTQSGLAVGTPHYMSPEQIIGKHEVDVRSDIYSLGATLHHMLTGIQPFKGTNMMEIMNRQLSNELESPRKVRPGLSDSICRVLEKMMAGLPEDRYQTPGELLEDLSLVLSGKPPRSVVKTGRSLIRSAA